MHYNFYLCILQRHSLPLARAMKHLEQDYSTYAISILQCFMDPSNYAIEKPEQPNILGYDPEAVNVRGQYEAVSGVDPIAELFYTTMESDGMLQVLYLHIYSYLRSRTAISIIIP